MPGPNGTPKMIIGVMGWACVLCGSEIGDYNNKILFLCPLQPKSVLEILLILVFGGVVKAAEKLHLFSVVSNFCAH